MIGVYLHKRIPTIERFLRHITIAESGCWIWEGAINPKGYSRLLHEGKNVMAHRFAYEYYVGKIPNGKEIDHLCRNRPCVNPDHLEAVQHRDNLLRGNGIIALNVRRTHCPKGHPYDNENTYVNANGGRSCKICRREYNRINRWRYS